MASNWDNVSFGVESGDSGYTAPIDFSKVSLDKRLSYYKEDGSTALSYSKLRTLDSCARKFQLQEKSERTPNDPSVHTAYGHAFGTGIQALWRTNDLQLLYGKHS